MQPISCVLALAAVLLAPASGLAEILWDGSPAGTGLILNRLVKNEDGLQYFGEVATFSQPVLLTGMDIYTSDDWVELGGEAKVRIWQNAIDRPGALIRETVEIISGIDHEGSAALVDFRAHVDFAAPLALAPGSYWFGMSGYGYDLAQWTLVQPGPPGNNRMYQFQPEWDFVGFTGTGVGDMAFRIHGVPEPSTFVLAMLGLIMFGKSRLRKHPRGIWPADPDRPN
jgi:hypothetical protein